MVPVPAVADVPLADVVPADMHAVTLSTLHRRLVQHARWQIETCERVAVLMMRGVPHRETREKLGVSVEEYRHVRRWLRVAVTGECGPIDVSPNLVANDDDQPVSRP